MFKRILLPLDRSDHHVPALQNAAELANQGTGQIWLVHVIEVIPGPAMDQERTFYNRLERSARKHLDRLAAGLAAQNIPWHAKVIYGNRAAEIARFAADNQCDLMILTSPRLGPRRPRLQVGEPELQDERPIPCPVLLVK